MGFPKCLCKLRPKDELRVDHTETAEVISIIQNTQRSVRAQCSLLVAPGHMWVLKLSLSKMGWNSKCSFSVALATSQMLTSPTWSSAALWDSVNAERPRMGEALLGAAFHELCMDGEREPWPREVGQRKQVSAVWARLLHTGVYISSSPNGFCRFWHPRLNVHISLWPRCWWDPAWVPHVL